MSLARNASLAGLAVVNVVLVAALAGAFGTEPLAGKLESPREPERLVRQSRPERMQQVAPDVAADATAGSASHVLTPASNPASTLAAPGGKAGWPGEDAAGVNVASARTEPARCLEMAALSEQAIGRVADALTRVGVTQVERFARDEPARWWVHLPPQPTRENVQRKLAELKRRNVTDVSLVESMSPESHTVSLGWFGEREQAERYLSVLREQGVRTAVLSEAPRATAPVSRPWLRVRNADASLLDRLDQARRRDVVAQQLRCT